MIATDARLVVIGDKARIDCLSAELSADGRKSIELRTPEEFLVPYDMETVQGEAQRRDMERLYAGLRGKILVRLLVANLNPEHVKQEVEPPLSKIRHEWCEIQRRRESLLNEAASDGISFITLLVAEEGEWTAEHRADLLALSGQSEVAEPDEHTPPHRCYLMTRLLELGTGSVCHARDAWPTLLACLLESLLRVCELEDRRAILEEPGLFAWRTVQFVAAVDPQLQAERTREVFSQVNDILLKSSGRDLFGNPLATAPQAEAGNGFPEPPHVKDMREAIGTTEWMQINDSRLLDGMIAPVAWKEATLVFAQSERATAGESRKTEALHEEGTAVKGWMEQARESPGLIAPNHLRDKFEPVSVGSVLASISAALRKAAVAQQRLRDYWAEHIDAARAAVSMRDRIIIGFVVAAALSYAMIVGAVVASAVLPVVSLNWMDALWVGGWSIAGVAFMIWTGHRLQRWRGETVKEGPLRKAAEAFKDAEAEVRHSVATTVRLATATSVLRRRIAARRVFHQRLSRAEVVLQNELQPLGVDQIAERPDEVEEAFRRLAVLEVEGPTVNDLEVEDVEKTVVHPAVEEFKLAWNELVGRDTSKVGFLPVADLLRLCSNHSKQLRVSVRNALCAQVLSKWRSNPQGSIGLLRDAISKAEIAVGARFFSADLKMRSDPHRNVWVVEQFAEAFDGSTDPKFGIHVSDANRLGSGVLAIWHGEVRLDISGSDFDGPISFAQAQGSTP